MSNRADRRTRATLRKFFEGVQQLASDMLRELDEQERPQHPACGHNRFSFPDNYEPDLGGNYDDGIPF